MPQFNVNSLTIDSSATNGDFHVNKSMDSLSVIELSTSMENSDTKNQGIESNGKML